MKLILQFQLRVRFGKRHDTFQRIVDWHCSRQILLTVTVSISFQTRPDWNCFCFGKTPWGSSPHPNGAQQPLSRSNFVERGPLRKHRFGCQPKRSSSTVEYEKKGRRSAAHTHREQSCIGGGTSGQSWHW
jgi:hypothetical protein